MWLLGGGPFSEGGMGGEGMRGEVLRGLRWVRVGVKRRSDVGLASALDSVHIAPNQSKSYLHSFFFSKAVFAQRGRAAEQLEPGLALQRSHQAADESTNSDPR